MHSQAKVRLLRCKGAPTTKSLLDPILGGEDARRTGRHQVAMSELISCPRFPGAAKSSGHTHQDRLPLLLRREVSRFLRIFCDATAAPVSCQKFCRQFLPVVLQRRCGQWTNVCGGSESLVHRFSWRARGGSWVQSNGEIADTHPLLH